MKESRFIAQNKEKWRESENLLAERVKDPDKLSNLFTQVVDDLSFSRTYYRHRSVRVYLNQLAREYFSIIYSHQKERKNRFKLFWVDEFPQLMIFSRRPMLISLSVFLLAVSIGVFSCIKDPDFASSILGENYVAMTQENIKKGDPMAVYKSGHQVDMFLGITFNNLRVAFLTYVMGIFMAIGTLGILVSNGVMLGCFQYFFVQHDLLAQSALSIWLHGTLEISSIILAGGAGLTLGSGLLFPGTYTRFQAFQISGVRSLKIMLGISPVFVLAGLIESFLTRYTDAPAIVKLSLILLSLAFIIGYFVVYPWRKAKSGFQFPIRETRISPDSREPINLAVIKTNGEIIQDVFQFFRQSATGFLPWVAVISVMLTAVDVIVPREEELRGASSFWFLDSVFYTVQATDLIRVIFNSVGTAVILFRVNSLLIARRLRSPGQGWALPFVQLLLLCGLFYTMEYTMGGWGVLLMIVFFGMFLLIAFVLQASGKFAVGAIAETLQLMAVGVQRLVGLQAILFVMMYSFLMVTTAPILYMLTQYFGWNFADTDTWAVTAMKAVETFVRVFAFNLVIPLLSASIGLLYFSLSEILTAHTLKESIAKVGSRLNTFRR